MVSGRGEDQKRWEEGRSYSPLYILNFNFQGDGKPLGGFEQRKDML